MKLAKRIFLFSFCGGALAVAAGVAMFFYFSFGLPTAEEISSRQISQSTKFFDRTGEVLLYEVSGGQKRTIVPLAEIPQYLKAATIAIEDQRFYESPGFDVKAIARALWTNFKNTGNPFSGQGASTITQQLARNAFLTSERTLVRKIKELALAMRVSRYYAKDKILELYLNEIPYGPTLYGVEAASLAYFGKSVKDVSLAEAAILAALPKAPTYYSPWGSHITELLSRQKLILEKMLELGKISEEEFSAALKERVVFQPQGAGLLAPHFVLAVRDQLVQKYGENLVSAGGLRVITTLDWDLQQVAEKAVKETAEENDRLYNGKNAALVAENPKTGEILALVGSRDYFATSSLPAGCSPGANCQFEPNFNVATQGLRQPGSALKPFVYLAAFEKGYTPDTVLFDVPTEFAAQNPACPPVVDFLNVNPSCFHPENFDGQFRGPVTMRAALGQSINVPAVKTLYLVGLENAVKRANEFGLSTLTSPNLYGLSLVLGGGAVRLIDLVGAYSALAQDGIRRNQIMVLEVRDATGNVLESSVPEERKVADPQPVRLINNILSDIEVRAGLFRNSLSLTIFPEYDVALKTGTSNDYRDAWAVGYTPSLVVGVWAGNNDNSPMREKGSSLLAAVPIWHKFMKEAINKIPKETFLRPEPVIPQKPIFAGDYFYNGNIHSILYYVDRKNPLGPPPGDGSSDPQFINWEAPVLAWVSANAQNLPVLINQTSSVFTESANKSFPPKIEIKSPVRGSFVGRRIPLIAEIAASGEIANANIYWNGAQINGFSINIPDSYVLNWPVEPPVLAPQNLLEVEVFDSSGRSAKEGVVVYFGQ